ncbi:hypothetical protein [Gynuella sunshinyii]|uniref:Uncharacterized protein n=1 Tax=Gynuella sunshinyii YC6258 TaxID=1445510 RepID=A0A0C5VS71_9GAMM|nr:hypothetical protein [Gynuella sunshinyii]AJQ97512.1 hypothetical Protein YC6258_05484 [Gynuella sunshinyii YC6258]
MSDSTSLFKQHDAATLRADKLPYQQGCALMAIAKTERKSSNQVLSEMRHEQGLASGKNLQHDATLLSTLGQRGYTAQSDGYMSWKDAQDFMKSRPAPGKGKDTRYFAMTFPPGTDPDKASSIGHAVSVSVSKSGGITVFANNSDRDAKGKWVGGKSPDQAGGRPFQSSMSDQHQIRLFKPPK